MNKKTKKKKPFPERKARGRCAYSGWTPRPLPPDGWPRAPHFERCLIFLRFFCKRRVRFFFHFQRNIERAFLYGFDLCAMPGQARAKGFKGSGQKSASQNG